MSQETAVAEPAAGARPAAARLFGWPAPKARPWRAAVLLPAALAVPWVLVARQLPVPAFFATLAGMLFCLALLTVLVTDFLWSRIYNWTTYPAFVGMWLLQVVALIWPAWAESPIGVRPLADQVAGMVLGFGVMYLIYSTFGGGAGDLKLVTVLGTMLGPAGVVHSLIYAYILAGVVVGSYLVWAVGPKAVLVGLARSLRLLPAGWPVDPAWREAVRQPLPLGPFLACGAFLEVAGARMGLF